MFNPINDPEIFIALVGRIGTSTRRVAAEIENSLQNYKYTSTHIQISELIQDAFPDKKIPTKSIERYNKLITLGNKYRKKSKNAAAAAKLAALSIVHNRKKETGDVQKPQIRHAYIVNQLKRPEEVDYFRKIYGERFFLVSCHAPRQARLMDLTLRMQSDHPENPDLDEWKHRSTILINRDEAEVDSTWGQRVADAFPMADLFVDVTGDFRSLLDRFFAGIFGDGRASPTREEYGAHLASVAALKSNDLSRQVGAAIVSNEGELISLGCNEVPKSGGGMYWEGDDTDDRDIAKGVDINSIKKKEMILDLISKMKKRGWLKRSASKIDEASVVADHIDSRSGFLRDSKIMDGIEFGRAIHAEMNAIIDAARFGRSTSGATMYVTTFPCHNCAKHIVGAGVDKVIYQEPYEKSKALNLYSKDITLDGEVPDSVNFKQFVGIGTRQYRRIYAKSRLKEASGKAKVFDPKTANPIRNSLTLEYLKIEAAAVSEADAPKG